MNRAAVVVGVFLGHVLAFLPCHAAAAPPSQPSAPGKAASPSRSSATAPPEYRVWVPYGSLAAPSGTLSVRTGGSVDFSLGYVRLPPHAIRVSWACGAIASDDGPNRGSLHSEATPGGLLLYRSHKVDSTPAVTAHIGRCEYTAATPSPRDLQDVLSLLRTYRDGPCSTCPKPREQK